MEQELDQELEDYFKMLLIKYKRLIDNDSYRDLKECFLQGCDGTFFYDSLNVINTRFYDEGVYYINEGLNKHLKSSLNSKNISVNSTLAQVNSKNISVNSKLAQVNSNSLARTQPVKKLNSVKLNSKLNAQLRVKNITRNNRQSITAPAAG